MEITIRDMTPDDWAEVCEILRQGMETGNATFDTVLPSYEAWDKSHLPHGRIVARGDGAIVGWAALSPTSARECYRGIAEVSVYIDEGFRGKGIGSALLEAVCGISQQYGYWTLQAVVVAENSASLRVHEKAGFRTVGRREKIAKDRFGRWRDTILLERRSSLYA